MASQRREPKPLRVPVPCRNTDIPQAEGRRRSGRSIVVARLVGKVGKVEVDPSDRGVLAGIGANVAKRERRGTQLRLYGFQGRIATDHGERASLDVSELVTVQRAGG